ncbi:MAG TPA: divalent metal cation transporter [Acetobacteraceae bacterium]|jgi:NRAMP (natural resistance-associated macrophage protein)-like metal ion transporter
MARFLAVFGPGLVVMLADTDVGSVITAGQSGVQWGYRLLPLQFLLIPVLYIVQELTVRLGIFTGRGHGELIRDTFGLFWAWVSAIALGIATTGALLTEFSGVAGVGELYGLSRAVSLPVAATVLLVVVITGSYRRVERVAIAVGLFELAFFFVAWAARPDFTALAAGSLNIPYGNKDYLYLVAANVGAVVMPWMIFYQQSAIADKRLRAEHFAAARWDTAVGAVVTQLVMAAVLIACAASIGRGNPGATLTSIGDMSQALTPFLGTMVGNLVFGMGVLGAGMVAAIVCSLAFAWGLGEVTGYRHSLEHRPLEARWFYGVYTACVVAGAGIVGFWPDLVSLNVGVQVMNAFLLPVVLGLLIALSVKALPRSRAPSGWYLVVILAVSALTCGLGVFGGVTGSRLFG